MKEAKNQIPFLCALEKWNLEFNAAHATKECLRHFGLPVVLRDRKRILRRNKDPAKKTSGSGEQQSSTTALTLSEIRGNVKWGWAREATKSGVNGFSQKYGLREDDGVETGGVFGRSEEGF